jgi:hypothetical protein
MQPRLNTSKKWTAIPAELAQQIKEVFTEGFGPSIKDGAISVEGRFYAKEILLRVGYLEKGRLAPANFEVSLDFEPAKQNAMTQIQFAMDCAASMMEDYLQNDEEGLADFPRTWEAFDIAGRQVFLKVTTENKALEAEANKLLDDDTEVTGGLVVGEDEEELRKQVYGMLGLHGNDKESSESEEREASDDHKGGHVHGPGCKHGHEHEHTHDAEDDEVVEEDSDDTGEDDSDSGKGHKHGPGCKH